MFASKDINLLIKSVTPSNLFVLSVHDMAKEVYCYLLEVSTLQKNFLRHWCSGQICRVLWHPREVNDDHRAIWLHIKLFTKTFFLKHMVLWSSFTSQGCHNTPAYLHGASLTKEKVCRHLEYVSINWSVGFYHIQD